MGKKRLVYNEAGWELGQRNPAPMTPRQVEQCSVDKVAGTDVAVYQLCLLTGNLAVLHRSSILEPYCSSLPAPYKMHMWRLRETSRYLAEIGTDVLEIVTRRCRELGMEPHASFRVNDTHHAYRVPEAMRGELKYRHEYYFPDLRSPWIDLNSHLWLAGGGFDFASEEVRRRKLASYQEVLERYDVDGLDLDFTRFPPFFAGEASRRELDLMTGWVEEIRTAVDAASRAKGRKIQLTARVEFDPGRNARHGLDVEAWVRKGLFETLSLGVTGDATPDASAEWLIGACRGTGILVCPSLEGMFYWIGGATGFDRVTTLENARAAAAEYYRQGADGLQFFNFCAADEPWDRRILEELAEPSRFARSDKHYVFTMWPGAIMCKLAQWDSSFVLWGPNDLATRELRLGDDFDEARRLRLPFAGRLTMQVDGLNRPDDVDVSLNGSLLAVRDELGFQFAWDSFCVDTLSFNVPATALRLGANTLTIERKRRYRDYDGHVEIQGLELEVRYEKEVQTSGMLVGTG